MESVEIWNRRDEKEEGSGCYGSGVSVAPAGSGSSTGVLAATDAAADADAGGGGGDGGTRRNDGAQDSGLDVGVVERLPAVSGAARTTVDGPTVTEGNPGRDLLELGSAASLEGGEVGREEARQRWQWQRGLRRMVDSDSPSVSNLQQKRMWERDRSGYA